MKDDLGHPKVVIRIMEDILKGLEKENMMKISVNKLLSIREREKIIREYTVYKKSPLVQIIFGFVDMKIVDRERIVNLFSEPK